MLAEPSPWARVTGVGDSAVNVTLRCWTTPDDWQNTKVDLIKIIKERFDGAGLSFPYPHQVSVEREPKAELPVRVVDAPAEGRTDASARPDAPED